MIDKAKVQDTMQRRRVTLAWDSQRTADKAEGKYVRERSAKPYHSRRWTELARAFLESHPLCEECKRKGIIRAAECVDHIDPWPICEDYFFDRRNLQALCNKCNADKGNRDKARIAEWRRTGEGASISPALSPEDHSPDLEDENGEKRRLKIYGRKQ